MAIFWLTRGFVAMIGFPDHKARPFYVAPKWVKNAFVKIQVTRGFTGYSGYPESIRTRPNCAALKWSEFGHMIVLPGGFTV